MTIEYDNDHKSDQFISENPIMQLSRSLKKSIKENLRNSILAYINHFRSKSSQPLDILIPKERKIRSIVGGLETSMGTTVWEPLAETLARENGFQVIRGKIQRPSPFPQPLLNELSRLISARENQSTWLSSADCRDYLRKAVHNIDTSLLKYVDPPAGTGVDLYFQKNGVEYAFDIKTVQPNLGSVKSFNKQLLEWYAYRLCRDVNANIICKIAYPYNPYSNDFWLHTPHNKNILEPTVDAVVESEFWDFISGYSNTFQTILQIFDELNHEGFGSELSSLINNIRP